MNTHRWIRAVAAVFLLPIMSAYSYEPSVYVSAKGIVEGYSDTSEIYSGGAVSGIFNWRGYNDAGYLALYASSQFTGYASGISDFQDNHSLRLSGGTRLKGMMRLESELSSTLSLHHIDYGVYASPAWSIQASLEDIAGHLSPAVEYFGSYTYQEKGTDDLLAHGTALQLSYDPSIFAGFALRVSGTLEERPDQYLVDSGGNDTNTTRKDTTVSAELTAEGLLGYFADWRGSVSAGMRRSNANRYISAEAEREADSEDRITSGFDYRLSWSPSREVSLTAALFGEGEWYTERQVLNDSGIGTGDLLEVYRAGGRGEADIALSDNLYALFAFSGYRSFSKDDDFNSWSFNLEGGLEYSF